MVKAKQAFKPGDRVKCVDSEKSGGDLKVGEIYRVIDCTEVFVTLYEKGNGWYANRFVLAFPDIFED